MADSGSMRARKFFVAAIAACGAAAALASVAQTQSLPGFSAAIERGRTAPMPVHVNPAVRDTWTFAGDDAPHVVPPALDRLGLRDMPSSSYCVRLCDGRYFPLPRRTGTVNMSSAQICSAMCPAARTEVFNGKIIDHAISSEGKPYSSLKNAFVYRQKTVEDCTCKHDGAPDIAAHETGMSPVAEAFASFAR